jgi:hypothetical protein
LDEQVDRSLNSGHMLATLSGSFSTLALLLHAEMYARDEKLGRELPASGAPAMSRCGPYRKKPAPR